MRRSKLRRLVDSPPEVGRLPLRARLRAPALTPPPTITGLDAPTIVTNSSKEVRGSEGGGSARSCGGRSASPLTARRNALVRDPPPAFSHGAVRQKWWGRRAVVAVGEMGETFFGHRKSQRVFYGAQPQAQRAIRPASRWDDARCGVDKAAGAARSEGGAG
ncbi:hypothetical protein EYR38_002047 [Pleurotus pulmonarius]|nr:hypothetical protein EYR38_002047 [Pleurotus pulmonarius]